MLIDLATAKLHLRVDGTDEDQMISLYLQAAEDYAAGFLNRNIYADETAKGDDAYGIVANSAIKAAILLMLGHLYGNREEVVVGLNMAAIPQQLPSGSLSLMQPYRYNMGV